MLPSLHIICQNAIKVGAEHLHVPKSTYDQTSASCLLHSHKPSVHVVCIPISFFERTARVCAYFIDKEEESTGAWLQRSNLVQIRPQVAALLPQAKRTHPL